MKVSDNFKKGVSTPRDWVEKRERTKYLKFKKKLDAIECFLNNTVPPLCECGCGGRIVLKKQHYTKGIPRFLQGHGSVGKVRVFSEKTKNMMSETRKRLFKSGELVSPTKGKTLEEYYGVEKAFKMKQHQSNIRIGVHRIKNPSKKQLDIWLYNRDGHNNGTCRKCGKRHYWTFPEDTKGKKLKDVIGEEASNIIGQKISKALKGKSFSLSHRKKLSIAKKDFKPSEDHLKKLWGGCKYSKNKLEKTVENYIREMDLPYKYVGDNKYRVTVMGVRSNPDFICITDNKKFIEVLGCYWHRCPECNLGISSKSKRGINISKTVERDKLKKVVLQDAGYKILYIWEHDVKNGNFKKMVNDFN